MMSHSFERFLNELYRRITSSATRRSSPRAQGRWATDAIVLGVWALDETLESRNLNPLYDRDRIHQPGERLLASEGAYRHLYSRQSVEKLLENRVRVRQDEGYAAALRALRGYGAREIEALGRGGYAAVEQHTLEHDRAGFTGFMERLSKRLGRPNLRWAGPDLTIAGSDSMIASRAGR